MDSTVALRHLSIDAEYRDWLLVFMNLCVALAHPFNRAGSRHPTCAFVRQLGNRLVDLGALSEAERDRHWKKAGIDELNNVVRDEVAQCETCHQVLVPEVVL